MSDKTPATAPIQLGTPIPGTQLTRRFQAGREISPLYVPEPGEFGGTQHALEAAEAHGYAAVTVYDVTYIRLFGDWFTFGAG